MSKQVNWGSKLQWVEKEIDLLTDLIKVKKQEKTLLESIVVGEEMILEPVSNFGNHVAEVAVENLNDQVAKRGPGRPKGSKNKPEFEAVESVVSESENFESATKRGPGRPKGSKNRPKFEPVDFVVNEDENFESATKRGPGRPKGSKNKPKAQDVTKVARVADIVVEDDNEDSEDLVFRLEKIGQNINRPIKLDDFVRILRREGFAYDSKVIRNELLQLVRIGKFIQNDDDERSYEYVQDEVGYVF